MLGGLNKNAITIRINSFPFIFRGPYQIQDIINWFHSHLQTIPKSSIHLYPPIKKATLSVSFTKKLKFWTSQFLFPDKRWDPTELYKLKLKKIKTCGSFRLLWINWLLWYNPITFDRRVSFFFLILINLFLVLPVEQAWWPIWHLFQTPILTNENIVHFP